MKERGNREREAQGPYLTRNIKTNKNSYLPFLISLSGVPEAARRPSTLLINTPPHSDKGELTKLPYLWLNHSQSRVLISIFLYSMKQLTSGT